MLKSPTVIILSELNTKLDKKSVCSLTGYGLLWSEVCCNVGMIWKEWIKASKVSSKFVVVGYLNLDVKKQLFNFDPRKQLTHYSVTSRKAISISSLYWKIWLSETEKLTQSSFTCSGLPSCNARKYQLYFSLQLNYKSQLAHCCHINLICSKRAEEIQT